MKTEEIRAKREAGMTLRAIAKEAGITYQAVALRLNSATNLRYRRTEKGRLIHRHLQHHNRGRIMPNCLLCKPNGADGNKN